MKEKKKHTARVVEMECVNRSNAAPQVTVKTVHARRIAVGSIVRVTAIESLGIPLIANVVGASSLQDFDVSRGKYGSRVFEGWVPR